MSRKRTKCRSKSCIRARKRQGLKNLVDKSCSLINSKSQTQVTLFEKYLQTQNWIEAREYGLLVSTLRRPLPVCFRARSEMVEDDFKEILQREGLHAKQLPGNAWQMPSLTVDGSSSIRFWLAKNTSQGNVARQEFVSMIPVFLLDIQSNHRVLDLCASPGSKTIQAVDSLYASWTESSREAPSGFVLANELDPRRAYVLAHRCRQTLSNRMVSLAVTCHNACKFPNILAPLHSERNDRSLTSREMPFDRIVCDVPCSGDGTLRKDLKVWRRWSPSYGMQLHTLQVRIAKRGIALLNIDGLMTYSTCSFHPIENEAVVAALLQTGCVEVVDCTAKMSGIPHRSGLASWKVLDDDCQEQTHEDRPDWPISLWSTDDHQEALKRCIRMVPQDSDTGGFFIALLRKVKHFPSPSRNTSDTTEGEGKAPRVTPQADHHKLYPRSQSKTGTNVKEENMPLFSRGPTGRRRFRIAPTLSNYLTRSPGSAKLNLVFAGCEL